MRSPTEKPLNETHFSEVDVALLYVEEARARTERAATTLRSAGADGHLVDALERAEGQLSEVHRTLMQGTLFAVPAAQTSL